MKKNLTDIKNQNQINSMISSQNEDTGLAAYNAKDTKPFEQKNMPKGCRCRKTTSDK